MLVKIWKTGLEHIKAKRPCQDRYLTVLTDDVLILAVADGHGGKAYVRSGFGARMACQTAADVLKNRMTDCSEYGCLVKDRFDSYVKKHLARKPLSDRERFLLGDNPPEYAYGTTLLAARITENETFILHIGDGQIHVINHEGRFYAPLPDDPDCVGNITSSLVMSDACQHIRSALYPGRAACAVLYSDGYEPDTLRPWQLLSGIGRDFSEEQIEKAVKDGDKRGDDQTVVIFCDDILTENGEFQTGFQKELDCGALLQEEIQLRKHCATLTAYLEEAVKRVNLRTGMEKQRLIDYMKPRYDEYVRIQNRLSEINAKLTEMNMVV